MLTPTKPRSRSGAQLTSLLALIALITSGCAQAPYRSPSAADLPDEKLATIESTYSSGIFILFGFVGGHRATLTQIDGMKVPAIGRAVIGPGLRVIESLLEFDRFTLGLGEVACKCEGVLHLDAREGKRYTIEHVVNRHAEGTSVELQIKEKDTSVIAARAECKPRPWIMC